MKIHFITLEMVVDFTFRLPCALKIEKDLKSSAYDGIVVIFTSDLEAPNHDELLKEHFISSAKVNSVASVYEWHFLTSCC
jgi:hypothetical protein